MSVRVRFAPSPSGSLHLGNARTALYNWLFARKRAGQFLIRIEDTDRERVAPGAEAAILDDLRWLGLAWDEEVVRQSARSDRYHAAAEQLVRQGAAYLCFCSPDELERRRRAQVAAGVPPRYDGRCRAIPPGVAARRRAGGEPAAVRFAVPPDVVVVRDVVKGAVEVAGRDLGDFVILRQDGSVAFNLGSVVDDAAMRVTHVIRGDDHLANTPRQIALGRALGYSVPTFAHLALIHGPDGAPLAKRHGAVSVAEYRDAGVLRDALVNDLALLGWSPPAGQDEVMAFDTLVRVFALDRVSRSPSRFDPERLAWFNRQHLRRSPRERLAALLGAAGDPLALRALEVIRRDARTLAEAGAALRRVLHPEAADVDAAGRRLLETLFAVLPGELGTEVDAQAALDAVLTETGVGRRLLMETVRKALTGGAHGLPVASLLWALGADEARRRLDRALGARP